MDRTSLEEKLKELGSQKESLVSLVERVELTEDKQIIIKFRFRELEAIS